MRETEPENWGMNDSANATVTHVQSASARVAQRSTPTNWATIR